MAIEFRIVQKYREAQEVAKRKGLKVSEKTKLGFESLLNDLESVLGESGVTDNVVTDSEILKDEGLIKLFNTPVLKNFFHNLLTPTARQAVWQARNEAVLFGDDFIGTEHLFFALTQISGDLQEMNIKPEHVKATLKNSPKLKEKVAIEREDLFFLPSVILAFDVAIAEAHRLGYGGINMNLLILGLTSADETSVIARLLEGIGVNRERVHKRMIERLPDQKR